jgi:hypothetical protein
MQKALVLAATFMLLGLSNYASPQPTNIRIEAAYPGANGKLAFQLSIRIYEYTP